MARIRGSLTTEGEVALVAATAKTILQVIAPSNHRVAVLGIAVSFDGTDSTAEPVLVEVLRQTDGGTMTGVTAYADTPCSETVQTSGAKNASAEPSAGNLLRQWKVHPQGLFERVFGADEEIQISGGGRLGIRCTAAAGVNAVATLIFEE